MNCPKCQQPISENQTVCYSCGARLEEASSAAAKKRRAPCVQAPSFIGYVPLSSAASGIASRSSPCARYTVSVYLPLGENYPNTVSRNRRSPAWPASSCLYTPASHST